MKVEAEAHTTVDRRLFVHNQHILHLAEDTDRLLLLDLHLHQHLLSYGGGRGGYVGIFQRRIRRLRITCSSSTFSSTSTCSFL